MRHGTVMNMSFDSSAILIAGKRDFNVKHYSVNLMHISKNLCVNP